MFKLTSHSSLVALARKHLAPLVLLAAVVPSALANQDKMIITIGSDPDELAHGDGRLVAGGGMKGGPHPKGATNVSQGQSASATAAAVAAQIGGTATANGNKVTVMPANSGGVVWSGGMYSDCQLERVRRPAPPANTSPRTIINEFGPAGGSVTINKDGSITKHFNGSGWSIIGHANFQQTDTLASINQDLFDSLVAQSANLPAGYAFQLASNGVELVNTTSDLFNVSVTDSISFAQGGATTGIDVGIGMWELEANAQPFSISGAGSAIPALGSGGNGVWPTTLAPNEFRSSIDVPTCALYIDKVRVFGLQHGWVGDVHAVLWDPLGRGYNLMTRPGSSGDLLNGTFEFVSAGGATIPTNGNVSGATYDQHFGSWPTGTRDIHNLPLSSIAAPDGAWTLAIYDWESGNLGSCTGWSLEGNSGVGPQSYCTSGTSSTGCNAYITANVNPSVSAASGCVISVSSVEGQKAGVIFYGINNAGFAPLPWGVGSSSFLCVKPPSQRTGALTSGGTLGACDGVLSIDWNAFQTANPTALGNPWSTGNTAYVQAWFRDPPSPKTTALSDALELICRP